MYVGYQLIVLFSYEINSFELKYERYCFDTALRNFKIPSPVAHAVL